MNSIRHHQRVLGLVVMYIALTSTLMFTGQIQAVEGKQPVILQSAKSFADTVAGIKGAIKNKGLAIIFEANHQNMIAMAGGATTPGVAIGFAKPQTGQLLLSKEPLANIEMPLRIAVRELANGKVYVIYYQPSYLFAHYNNPKLGKLGEKMDKMVGMIAKAGTQ
ncbi:MAG: hypothetical protein BMS9Abin09_0914 [Gammaproteobacteria bacterium]|nr:MAG: hypothetical protein BMS9Abin09_0914 [Gammaproteobacteria bacterium]